MTHQSQKEEELFYLERFRIASGLLPDAEAEPHEVPDFLIRTPSEIVGLEITKYYIPAAPNARPRQEQESLRRRVLNKASALHAPSASGPIHVSAHFNGYVPIRKTQISDLAKKIVSVVLNYRLSPWERVEVQWEDGLSTLPGQEKGTGYFSSGFLGLPRFRIVDSNPSATAIFACQSSLP